MVEYERTGELLVHLASDQTSLHNPFGGGYYPVQLSYNEAQKVMSSEPLRFKELVQERYTFCAIFLFGRSSESGATFYLFFLSFALLA